MISIYPDVSTEFTKNRKSKHDLCREHLENIYIYIYIYIVRYNYFDRFSKRLARLFLRYWQTALLCCPTKPEIYFGLCLRNYLLKGIFFLQGLVAIKKIGPIWVFQALRPFFFFHLWKIPFLGILNPNSTL